MTARPVLRLVVGINLMAALRVRLPVVMILAVVRPVRPRTSKIPFV
jgi:threonine/homoserine efflux transporter RhtA